MFRYIIRFLFLAHGVPPSCCSRSPPLCRGGSRCARVLSRLCVLSRARSRKQLGFTNA